MLHKITQTINTTLTQSEKPPKIIYIWARRSMGMGMAPTMLGQNNIRLINKFNTINHRYNQMQCLLNRYKAISNQSTPLTLPTTAKNRNKTNYNVNIDSKNSLEPYPMSSHQRAGILKKPRPIKTVSRSRTLNTSNPNLHKTRFSWPTTTNSSSFLSHNYSDSHRMLMITKTQQQLQQLREKRHHLQQKTQDRHQQPQIVTKNQMNFMKKSYPIVSNMPFINFNSSLILVNTSPFALSDPRFGILHHDSPSLPYF